jgi:predicted kinase
MLGISTLRGSSSTERSGWAAADAVYLRQQRTLPVVPSRAAWCPSTGEIDGLVSGGGLSLSQSGALWEARWLAYGSETDVPSTLVLTGVMAVGKSTVADLLARQFRRSVHLRGDVFRKMIVAGRDPIVSPLSPEAVRRLELRRWLAALVAGEYLRDGFTVVLQDIYVGADLSDILTRLGPPLYLVALTARAEVIAQRERQRGKTGYGDWSVAEFCTAFVEQTPRVGLWIDTSDISPKETVALVLAHLSQARVG